VCASKENSVYFIGYFVENIWGVGNQDSHVALSDTIIIRMFNNCFQFGITVVCSNFYLEGNCCMDIVDSVWFDTMSSFLSLDFFRDRICLPNYRFS